ncbi:AMED_5909 family protein [Amycolatopsis minnesotensis]|uniref:AMED_5909 family protein n=1 Tax=Amycolatopsis minnesotensis TaxID=337894 RepID=UPI0031D41B46
MAAFEKKYPHTLKEAKVMLDQRRPGRNADLARMLEYCQLSVTTYRRVARLAQEEKRKALTHAQKAKEEGEVIEALLRGAQELDGP